MNIFANDGQRLLDAISFAPLVLVGPLVLIGGIIYLLIVIGPWSLLGILIFLVFDAIQVRELQISWYFLHGALHVVTVKVHSLNARSLY